MMRAKDFRLGFALALVLGLSLAGAGNAADGETGKTKAKKKKEEKEKEVKPTTPPPPPSISQKTGEPIRDYIVDFEAAYAEAQPHFAVAEDQKHDYEACQKCAEKIEKAARAILKLHEDRLRQFGNDYHHQLELLATNAHRLRVAVSEHHRTDIFTYWAQLRLMRDTLAQTVPWK